MSGAVALCAGVFAQGGIAETIRVPNDKPASVTTGTALDPSVTYQIVASGKVSLWRNVPGGADAVWCFSKSICGSRTPTHELRVRRADEEWIGPKFGQGLTELAGSSRVLPYSKRHIYRIWVTGIEGKLTFAAGDALAGSGDDNTGAFLVTITTLGRSLPAIRDADSFRSFLSKMARSERAIVRTIDRDIARFRNAKNRRRATVAWRKLQAHRRAYSRHRSRVIARLGDANRLLRQGELAPESRRCLLLVDRHSAGLARHQAAIGRHVSAIRARNARRISVTRKRQILLARQNRTRMSLMRRCAPRVAGAQLNAPPQ